MRATDVMSTPVTLLDRNTTLDEAVEVLTRARISGAPVVNHRGEPVGVLSLFDVVSYLNGIDRSLGKLGSFYYRSAVAWETRDVPEDEDDEFLVNTQVDDVMTPQVIGVAPDTTLDEVVREFAEREVHRVLVLEEGRIVGILTTLDIMRALAGMPNPRRAVAQAR